MMLGAVGLLFVLIFAMHTESSTESGHLWWKKTTTTDIPVGERLPLLVVGLVLIGAAALLAWSAFRKFKLQDNNVAAVAGAASVRQKRAAARALAERDPQMARDLRIGRPDLPRDYDDGGLVDLNTASTEVLVTWLDLSIAQAARIVAVRQELGRFQHNDDLLTLAELDQHTFDRISARVLVL